MKQKVRQLVCDHLMSQQCAPCSSCSSCIPRRSPVRPSATQVLAAQTLKIASINGLGDTEKLETELEDEIRWEESRHPPSETIGRVRRACEEFLHTKPMLLFIVLLNVIDTLLVIGELTLDFHHLSNRVLARKDHSNEFYSKMERLYPEELQGMSMGADMDEVLTSIFNSFLHSYVVFNVSQYSAPSLAHAAQAFLDYYHTNSSSSYNGSTSAPLTDYVNISSSSRGNGTNVLVKLLDFSAAPLQFMRPVDTSYNDAVDIAHALHYSSLSILSFLMAETLLKIVCVGRRFLKKKMEMFDAFIILVSFTLDIVFVEGLTSLALQHYVIVMSFLLPWRVLRVLNSLIVAVMIQHRFHLKLLYKQKRKITKQYTEATDTNKSLEKQVELLKALCNQNGVPDWQINKAIGQTLTTSGQSGLKALSKLVFHAAESFAPMSSSQSNLNNNHNGGCGGGASTSSSSPIFLSSADHRTTVTTHHHHHSTPSITICNGDVEQGGEGPPNGHVHVLQEESHVEDEVIPPESARQGGIGSSSPRRRRSGRQKNAGHTLPSESQEEDEEDEKSSAAEGPGEELSGDEEEGKEECRGDEDQRRRDEEEGVRKAERKEEGEGVDEVEGARVTFYNPSDNRRKSADDGVDASSASGDSSILVTKL